MSRNINELLPDVILSAPGVPPMVALQALSSSVRAFLEATSAWKLWLDPIDVTAGDATYQFRNHLNDDTKRWARIKQIEVLQWAPTGREIKHAYPDELQQQDSQWRTRTAAIPSRWLYEIDDGSGEKTIRLYPVPAEDVTDALIARVSIVTHTYAGIGATNTDTQPVLLPEEVFQKFRDPFVYGALARLYMIPKRDWTDFSLGRHFTGLVAEAVISAKSESDNEYSDDTVTVEYGGL